MIGISLHFIYQWIIGFVILFILETLDIPIVNNGEIRINPDGMIRLSDCYKSEVNNALSYQNTSNYTK